mgnify:CR=1 FL=1
MEIKELSDCVQILWPDRWQNIYPGDEIPEGITDEVRSRVEAWLEQCRIELQAQAMDAEAENEVFEAVVAENKAEEDAEKKRLLREILIEEGVIPGK